MRKVASVFFRVLFGLLVLVVMGVAAVTLALRLPSVQTRVVQTLADSVSSQLGYPVHIGGVRYQWFDQLTLDRVSLRDPQQRPMIDVARLDVNLKLGYFLAPFPTDSFRFFGYTVRYKNYTKVAFSNRIRLDRVRVVRPTVALNVNPRTGDLNIDEFIAKIDSLTRPATPRVGPAPPDPLFTIDQATIEGGTFRYDDPRSAPVNRRGTFDYNHFTVNEISADLADFLLVADTVAFQADNLRGVDPVANLRIRELDTKFFFSKKQMRFDGLLARVNRSVIRRNVAFLYGHRRDLGDFNEKVRIVADLDSTVVFSDDLARFSRPLYGFHDVWRASGHMNGTVRDFRFTKARLFFGKQSRAFGTMAFRGLPDFETSTMDFELENSVATATDLAQYVGKATTASIAKFFPVRFDAAFRGRYNDFQTKGIFRTPMGRADPDLTMKLAQKSANSTYRGNLKLVDFDLGKLIDDPKLLQRADLSGRIEGRGFSVEDAKLDFDGSVSRIGIRGYDYRRAQVDGKLQQGLFDGQVTLRDTNLVFNLAGRVDLRNRRNFFDLKGKLARANLLPLGFSDQDIQLHSDLDVVFTGLKLDELYGAARLRNAYLTLDKRSLVVDSLFVLAPQPNERGERLVTVRSDLLDASAYGPFRFSQVAQDLPRLFEEYRLYFTENEATRQDYYARRAGKPFPRYAIQYQVSLKNTNPLLAFFYPEGYVSPGGTVDGELRLGNTSVFTMTARMDTLVLGKYRFFGSEIDLNTSKLANRPDVLASAVVTSQQQDLGPLAPTEALEWEGSWEQDRIAFTSSLRQTASPNRANLNGTLRFTPEGTELRFRRGRVRIEDADWALNPGNLISVAGSTVRFNDITFRNADQILSVQGVIAEDSAQTLNLAARDFRLETLAPVIDLDLKGALNAAVTVRDAYRNLRLDGTARVDELVYRNVFIGNLAGEARWDALRQQVNVSANVDRMNNRIVVVKGVFDPKKEENSLNLTATLSQTSLEILQPFTEGLFSALGGTASGQVRIGGTPRFPLLNGEVAVRRGRLTFDYLKSVLRFEDKIYFDGSDITARRLRLTDDEGNPGTLSGGVFYDGAGNFALSLKANLTNFRVMNLGPRDNPLFYGTAYVTTTGPNHLEILGPVDNLTIRANATTNRNTKIYIPFDNAASVSSDDFITLLSEKLRQDSIRQRATATGQPVLAKRPTDSRIRMDFDFNVTPDAYCELQLNRQTGEGISANGRGRLRLGIDTEGDFTMSGVYTIEQGKYSFKYANLIDKPFEIRPGSRISWAGDPYEAIIDVRAAYRALTSYASVMQLSETERKDPQYLRRYPASVVINLSDRLLAPTISYNLELKDYPKTGPFVRDIPAFEARLQNDDQELSRQVSSVLAFGQLIPTNGNTQTFAAVNYLNTLSELLANQASSWLSQINPNLQINYLSLNGASTTTNQALIGDPRASISYNFRDRIRITRDGGFSNSAYIGNANLIGDWSVEVLITKDGQWRGKAFNRFVQNPFAVTLNNQSVANFGASLLYTQSFNYFFRPKTPTIPYRRVTPVVPTEEPKPTDASTTSQVGAKKAVIQTIPSPPVPPSPSVSDYFAECPNRGRYRCARG